MVFGEIVSRLSIAQECKKYRTPLWQCPQFLFFIMGVLIIASMVASFVIGTRYIGDPYLTLLLILAITGVMMALAFIITRSFEQLAEASRLKSEFIGIVSHQLRSPLTNLKWGLDFLMDEGVTRTTKEAGYFQVLRENIGRMHELVNDLLTVSRVEEGTLPFQQKTFALQELIEQVLGEFQSAAQSSNVEIHVQGERIANLTTDPSIVHHVLSNLIDNAIRYAWREKETTPSEKRRQNYIAIRYRGEGSRVRVEIQDNGLGIPAEDQKYIFQKFFRSTNAQRAQTQGSGLGLFIVKSLIEKAGGEIGFHSQENKGSTFWFTLPYRTKT